MFSTVECLCTSCHIDGWKWAQFWVITEQIVSNRGASHVATNRDAPSVNSSTLCTVHSYLKHFQIDSREPTIYWSLRSWQSTKATRAGITFEVKVLNDNQIAQQCLRYSAIKWLCLVLGLQCPVCLRKIFFCLSGYDLLICTTSLVGFFQLSHGYSFGFTWLSFWAYLWYCDCPCLAGMSSQSTSYIRKQPK